MNEYELIHLIIKDASWAGATIVIALSMKPIISVIAKYLEQWLFKNGKYPSFGEMQDKLDRIGDNDLNHLTGYILQIKESLQGIDKTLERIEQHEQKQSDMLIELRSRQS